jgi:membrane protein implicated in regulation of membrane protease activity
VRPLPLVIGVSGFYLMSVGLIAANVAILAPGPLRLDATAVAIVTIGAALSISRHLRGYAPTLQPGRAP